jgi:4-amino-4-deoxy-L-arabinose transferase-like glycosyltransferase
MWLRGDFLVPHLNGRTYSDKPPLLFWIYNLGWAIAGVNDIWPRLVSPLFGAASLLLTAGIARRLWPGDRQIQRLAPLVTLSSFLWMIFVSAAMFDMLVVFFTLLGVLGIIRTWQDSDPKGWLMAGMALGFGTLAKGPVIFIHTLPLALLAPWWAIEHRPRRWTSWYAGILGATLIGALMALAWAVPAAHAGGEEYSQAIFWGQSAGRVAKSFAHQRPLLWYVPLLPLILFPWPLWPALWRSLRQLAHEPASSAVRLCIAWAVPVFIIFSLISGKQPHYLLPLFPAFGLISAYALSRSFSFRKFDMMLPGIFILTAGCFLLLYRLFPLKPDLVRLLSGAHPYCSLALVAAGVALPALYRSLGARWHTVIASSSSVILAVVLYAGLTGTLAHYDMRDFSAYVGRLQRSGIPVAYIGKYHGTFGFLGRLERPLDVVSSEQIMRWAAQHPAGRIIADEDDPSPGSGAVPEYEHPYGFHTLKVWKCSSFACGRQ